MLDTVLACAVQVSGCPLGGIAVGQRADFGTLGSLSPGLLGVPPSHVHDAWVASSPGAAYGPTAVAAQLRGVALQLDLAQNFVHAMDVLWNS
jgi:hypothetical protein